MSILDNASEIDRLYRLHDDMERDANKYRKAAEQATIAEQRAVGICEGAMERIEVLFDGMAASVPSNVEEALGLAVLLRSQTDGSVFLEHDGEARERADRIIDNLVIGLKRLAGADRLPHWFEEQIAAAEIGGSMEPDVPDLIGPSNDEKCALQNEPASPPHH